MIEFEFLTGALDFYWEDEDGNFVRERGVTGLSCIIDNTVTVSIEETLKAAGWEKYGDWYFLDELNRTIDHEVAHVLGATTENSDADEYGAIHFEEAGAWSRR